MSIIAAMDISAALARNEIFAALPAASRIALASVGYPIQLEKGKQLFARGDPSDCVFVVMTGELEVTRASPDGQEILLARLTQGALIGEMGILDGCSRSADAVARRRTNVWRIGRQAILQALKDEPDAALALLKLLAQRLRNTNAVLHRTAALDLGGRLARLLLDESGTGNITLSQSEMGRLIGASRERVNRKLVEWRHKRWIASGPAGIVVQRPQALMALCEPTVNL